MQAPQRISELEVALCAESTQQKLIWNSTASTHVGRVRHINEDAFFSADEQRIWAVADGMGGHSRGDYASKSIVMILNRFVRQETLEQNINDIEDRLIEINQRCLNAFKRKRVGTTIALLFEFANHCFFIWAGDSRIYRLREGNLNLMTLDHSLAQEKYARGELSLEEASTHPSANILTRAIGVHQSLRLEMQYTPAKAGDRYLICSDGLYNDLDFESIRDILSNTDSDQALNGLIDCALDKGGRDNITAMIIDTSHSE